MLFISKKMKKNFFFIGFLVPTLVLLVAGVALLTITARNPQFASYGEYVRSPYIWGIAKFTIFQALLSTALSVFLGLCLARSLFISRILKTAPFLLPLLSVPIIMPTIVAIFGIANIYGQNGWANNVFHFLSIEKVQFIYNIYGILLAHCFFNIPIITRIALQIYQNIPPQTWRLAKLYNLTSWQRFQYIEWPYIRSHSIYAVFLIFLLCFTSFAVVLTLGGGPQSSTFEVAIYYAVKIDLDWHMAGFLAMIQIAICSLLYLLLTKTTNDIPYLQDNKIAIHITFKSSLIELIFHTLCILILGLVIIMPIISIFISGFVDLFFLTKDTYLQIISTIFSSLKTAFISALFGTLLSSMLAFFVVDLKTRYNTKLLIYITEFMPFLIIITPPIVITSGLFIFSYQYIDLYKWSAEITIILHILIFFPFLYKYLKPVIHKYWYNYYALCQQYNIHNLKAFWFIFLPLLWPYYLRAFSIAFALSIGDISVVLFFGNQDFMTLSMILYQKLSHYQFTEAGGIAVLLLSICITVFMICEFIIKKGNIKRDTHAQR